ncbi:Small-conductance mechanosensitive channel [Crateriforma conspicua]|uniref:Small-conductance mechanosensitive channel n=2 Tax=Crateriforma conspicua TaxID=2527996 RepID=A0A5C5Y8U3_9PLAN|nr:mechanosensitive ion channel domain-containing protein [Crateriforma conspicua]QDV65959.1 Small-conductance mechanosensitive channel [Crateriforma conspicua]TWT71328.1 Small-conductance mechanosensitive channel [Crateriforma conspicua]
MTDQPAAGAAETLTDQPDMAQSVGDTLSTLIEQMQAGDYEGLTATMTQNVVPGLLAAAIGLGVIFIGYLVASYISRIISGPICRRVDQTLGKFIGRLVFYSILAGVTAAVLSKLGAPLGGLAAMLAAAGFAVGLAFQGTLSNFASGVLMMVFRPFKVGDFINAGGVAGTVNEIDLFTTTLDTPDNRRIIVPNSSIAGGTIENISHHAHRRVEVVVGVDYSANQDETRAALTRAAESLSDVMIPGDDRGYAVVLSGLGDSAVEWKVRLWVASSNYWPAHEALTGAVKRNLDAVEIGIPFPQMDIHLHRVAGDDDGSQPTPRQRPRPTRRDAIAG